MVPSESFQCSFVTVLGKSEFFGKKKFSKVTAGLLFCPYTILIIYHRAHFYRNANTEHINMASLSFAT